jgi:SAM-dependent methyltransferase
MLCGGVLHHPSDTNDRRDQIRKYWDDFYKLAGEGVPKEESAFARHVASSCGPFDILVEFGCGSGRDAKWFATTDRCVVVATDVSHAALDLLADQKHDSEGNRLITQHVDIDDADSLASLAEFLSRKYLQSSADPKIVYYGRFLIHAIEASAQEALIKFVGSISNTDDILALEYRTSDLEAGEYAFGTHYRRPVSPHDVERQCRQVGFREVKTTISDSFAIFRQERPVVARTIARK